MDWSQTTKGSFVRSIELERWSSLHFNLWENFVFQREVKLQELRKTWGKNANYQRFYVYGREFLALKRLCVLIGKPGLQSHGCATHQLCDLREDYIPFVADSSSIKIGIIIHKGFCEDYAKWWRYCLLYIKCSERITITIIITCIILLIIITILRGFKVLHGNVLHICWPSVTPGAVIREDHLIRKLHDPLLLKKFLSSLPHSISLTVPWVGILLPAEDAVCWMTDKLEDWWWALFIYSVFFWIFLLSGLMSLICLWQV